MKQNKGFLLALGATLLLLILAAGSFFQTGPVVEGAAAQLTVTFTGSQCATQGSLKIAPGAVTFKWTVAQGNVAYRLAVATLEDGKTIDDLNAWQSADPPVWQRQAAVFDVDPGGPATASLDRVRGPFYLVCYTTQPDAKVGAIGPITVVP